MSKVSVIVPVYNVERYLRVCMDSLIAQTLEDIEIIVVNDGSPDNSLEILQEYERKFFPKVKVYTIENHGVSYARNYGADRASGEYLMFVDSDDFVEPDLCRALYEKAEKDGNDLVLCNRNDLYEWQTGEDVVKPINLTTGNQNFQISQHPYELVWLSPFPWDKMVKRELFLKIRFPENMRFEDLAYVLKVACIAENIGVVRKSLYNYRRTTGGGFLNSFTEETLDIIRAFDNVLAFMEEQGFREKYEEEIAYICTRHFFFRYPALLDKKNTQWGLKRRMVQETQAFLDERFPNWRENHYLKYSSSPSIKKHLHLYCSKTRMLALLTVEQMLPEKLWNGISRVAGKGRKFLGDFKKASSKKKFLVRKFKILRLLKMPATYEYTKAYLKYPVDKNTILFESKHGEDIAGNIFHMICTLQNAEFEKYHLQLVLTEEMQEKWDTFVQRYNLKRVQAVKLNSAEYYRALACAGYLVTDTSFPSYYIKKPDQVYLNTWHGTPLKGMGRQVPGREFGLGNVQRNFLIADWLLYQDEFSRDIFIDDYMLRHIYPGKIMLSGYPRNSALFNQKLGEEIRRNNGLEGKTLIAYMPTWRGVLHKKNFGKQIKEVYQYLLHLDELLRDNQILFVKLHPFVGDTIDYSGFKHIRTFLPQYDTYDFLNATDMLVTDYSSIMFDYAVSGKKIILFAYDKEEYLQERGMYIDLETVEFPVVENVPALVEEFDRPNAGYPKFQKEFCKYDSEETVLEVCRTMLTGRESVKCEAPPFGEKRPNVLIYVEGIKDKFKFEKIIKDINNLNLDEYHYYLVFRAASAKSNTELLQKLDSRVGYIPLQRGINALIVDYAAKWVYQNIGLSNAWIEKTLKSLCTRELEKNFGKAEFAYVIYYSGSSSMNIKTLSYMHGKKICNLTAYSQKMYDADTSYRKFIRTITKGRVDFDIFWLNEECTKSGWYQKTKDRINYRLMEDGKNSIQDLMEVQQ